MEDKKGASDLDIFEELASKKSPTADAPVPVVPSKGASHVPSAPWLTAPAATGAFPAPTRGGGRNPARSSPGTITSDAPTQISSTFDSDAPTMVASAADLARSLAETNEEADDDAPTRVGSVNAYLAEAGASDDDLEEETEDDEPEQPAAYMPPRSVPPPPPSADNPFLFGKKASTGIFAGTASGGHRPDDSALDVGWDEPSSDDVVAEADEDDQPGARDTAPGRGSSGIYEGTPTPFAATSNGAPEHAASAPDPIRAHESSRDAKGWKNKTLEAIKKSSLGAAKKPEPEDTAAELPEDTEPGVDDEPTDVPDLGLLTGSRAPAAGGSRPAISPMDLLSPPAMPVSKGPPLPALGAPPAAGLPPLPSPGKPGSLLSPLPPLPGPGQIGVSKKPSVPSLGPPPGFGPPGKGVSVMPAPGASIRPRGASSSSSALPPPPSPSVRPGSASSLPAPPPGSKSTRPLGSLPPPSALPRSTAGLPRPALLSVGSRGFPKSTVLAAGGVVAVLCIGALGWALTGHKGKVAVFAAGEAGRALENVSITVDGAQRCQQSPCMLELSKGVHSLKISADGYVDQEHGVTISSGDESALNVKLERSGAVAAKGGPHGTVHLDVKTQGANVAFVSPNQRISVTDFSKPIELDSATTWTVEATQAGYSDMKQPVAIEPGGEKTITIALDPAAQPPDDIETASNTPAAPAGKGKPGVRHTATASAPAAAAPAPAAAPAGSCKLNFNSLPVSNVVLDGKQIGHTPKLGYAAPPGAHSVQFINGDEKKIASVMCKAGEQKTVVMRFTSK